MSGETILTLRLVAHEDGQLEIDLDTDRDPAQVRALLQLVIDQMTPRDRADEFSSFGADRRRR